MCVCVSERASVCSLSSSIWVEVAPEMFTGGFSPSTYCQQFKGLSAPTLCICVFEAESERERERVWRGLVVRGMERAVKRTENRGVI